MDRRRKPIRSVVSVARKKSKTRSQSPVMFARNFETKRYRDRRPNGKKIIRDLLQELGSKSGAR
jgi:hypothetical protein